MEKTYKNKEIKEMFGRIGGLYDDQLSNEELFEISNNLIGFFELLVSIDQRNSKAKNTENEQNYD